ncbi:hypothetical protein [Burkholderia pseudomallei]|uniref:hypothetical protein n=1 Tax=Burkholderia pseudomallei TaxID=28450 RepID=UPI0022EA88EE|nr:hypothetical protein [Burkholderia pseudomallei]
MDFPLSYVQLTACAEREIQYHLNEAASRERGGHAADMHLGAAIGAFDFWRCLMVEVGVPEVDETYMSDAQRFEALVRLASSSVTASSSDQDNGETA